MMGWQTGDQRQLFYLFNLERRIPASHLLRRINSIVMQVLADLREKAGTVLQRHRSTFDRAAYRILSLSSMIMPLSIDSLAEPFSFPWRCFATAASA